MDVSSLEEKAGKSVPDAIRADLQLAATITRVTPLWRGGMKTVCSAIIFVHFLT